MGEVTLKSLTNQDISIERLENVFISLEKEIYTCDQMNLLDVNIYSEKIFCKILNRVYDLNLGVASEIKNKRYPAVDLIDDENQMVVQVTATDKLSKIQHTLRTFDKFDIQKNEYRVIIFFLKMHARHYRKTDRVKLKNGCSFSILEDIWTFGSLLKSIQEKSAKDKNLISDVYDVLIKLYEFGRSRLCIYSEQLNVEEVEQHISAGYLISWEKKYVDVELHAFIPRSYTQEISCLLKINQLNVRGVMITLSQDSLIKSYFVSKEEFVNRHHVSQEINDDNMYMQIENNMIIVNAHTAEHIFELFEALHQYYQMSIDAIDEIMGTKGFSNIDGKFELMKISCEQWNEIKYFACLHRYDNYDKENEWNIFNNNWYGNSFMLMPNYYRQGPTSIFAKISMQKQSGKCVLLWEPGFVPLANEMEHFDNVLKWKADFTKQWLEEKLLKKVHEYYILNENIKVVGVKNKLKFLLKKYFIL